MRTLLRNGRVLGASGAEGSPEPASAVLITDATITWIGPSAAAAALGPVERSIDLAGALVTPAFVDAHVHLTQTGLMRTALDLRHAHSAAEVLHAVAVRARAGPDPVLGFGWDEQGWPDPTPPTAVQLSRAAGGASVYLGRIDAHSGLVSADRLDGPCAALDGYSTDGWLRAAAHTAVRRRMVADLTPAQRRTAQRRALAAAAAAGIGCVHEMATPELSSAEDLVAALELGRTGGPTVVGYWGALGAAEQARALGAAGSGGDLNCDGSIGSGTAAFHEAYADGGGCGRAYLDADAVCAHVLAAHRVGLPVGFHAIGDAAVDAVLAGLERAAAVVGLAAVRAAGHRIEHAELVNDPARLAALGVIASVQPAFASTWGGPDGMYARRLGVARAARLNDLAALAGAGVPLAFGSDSPVTPFDPWAAVQAAMYPPQPSAALGSHAAFLAHTRGGWRAAGRVGADAGVLAVGAPATLAVWSAGALVLDPPHERTARCGPVPGTDWSGLPDLQPGVDLPRCLLTVVGGRVGFDAGAL